MGVRTTESSRVRTAMVVPWVSTNSTSDAFSSAYLWTTVPTSPATRPCSTMDSSRTTRSNSVISTQSSLISLDTLSPNAAYPDLPQQSRPSVCEHSNPMGFSGCHPQHTWCHDVSPQRRRPAHCGQWMLNQRREQKHLVVDIRHFGRIAPLLDLWHAPRKADIVQFFGLVPAHFRHRAISWKKHLGIRSNSHAMAHY